MSLVDRARQIKIRIEELEKKGVKGSGTPTLESDELAALYRERAMLKGDLAARGIDFDAV